MYKLIGYSWIKKYKIKEDLLFDKPHSIEMICKSLKFNSFFIPVDVLTKTKILIMEKVGREQ